ncbi:MAG: histidine kinase [Blautia sp.]|nr:histidine kinase [Blautia sp.]
MSIQKTGWGEIRWQDEEAKVLKNRRLQVGEVRINGKAHQVKHLHYDEQVMYCLSGEAVSAVNGESEIVRAGDCIHYPAGIEHEIWVLSEEPFIHLLVSNPMHVGNDTLFATCAKEKVDPKLFYIAVEAVRVQFLESLDYSYAIFDNLGNLVLQSHRFPQHCVHKCNPGDSQGNCPCMRKLSLEQCRKQSRFTCPYEMEVLHNPIFFQDQFLGYIQGGFFRHSGVSGEEENIYDVPDSVVVGVGALLRRVVKAIRNYCEFEQFRQELSEKELQIASETEKKAMMLTDLRKAQKEVTDLKINNHFLFNSLNQMASMAVEGGQIELYQSIVNLSKMFHYTLRTQSQVVPLFKELEYVDAYLQLQKLRYQDQLVVEKDVDPELLSYEVPFNFLQPIVENAFLHGFHDIPEKWIRIEGKKIPEGVCISVINSGNPLAENEIRTINYAIRSNISHGLSMIYQKLKVYMDGNALLQAGLSPDGKTCFQVILTRE